MTRIHWLIYKTVNTGCNRWTGSRIAAEINKLVISSRGTAQTTALYQHQWPTPKDPTQPIRVSCPRPHSSPKQRRRSAAPQRHLRPLPARRHQSSRSSRHRALPPFSLGEGSRRPPRPWPPRPRRARRRRRRRAFPGRHCPAPRQIWLPAECALCRRWRRAPAVSPGVRTCQCPGGWAFGWDLAAHRRCGAVRVLGQPRRRRR